MSGKRTPKRSSLGPTSGFAPCRLMWSRISDERALRVAEIDASGGVGEDDGANAHASEDADGERDFLRGISFVEMDAALHGGDGDVCRLCRSPSSGVADGGRAREGGDVGVGDAGGVGERVGEAAEAGAEDEADLAAEAVRFRMSCAAESASANWSVMPVYCHSSSRLAGVSTSRRRPGGGRGRCGPANHTEMSGRDKRRRSLRRVRGSRCR